MFLLLHTQGRWRGGGGWRFPQTSYKYAGLFAEMASPYPPPPPPQIYMISTKNMYMWAWNCQRCKLLKYMSLLLHIPGEMAWGGGGWRFPQTPCKYAGLFAEMASPSPPPNWLVWVPLKHIHVGPELSNKHC